MGLRFTDSQLPHYPPAGSFRVQQPRFVPERNGWIQTLPRYTYEADVEYNARARLAPAPRAVETWQIGIVQNVLYEQIYVRYRDQSPHTITWRRPALDIGSETYRPFYNAPEAVENRIIISIHGIEREIVDVEQIVAVHEVLYGSRGIGYLYNPFEPIGYVPAPSQFLRLRMVDQPAHALRDWLGGELEEAYRIMVMRFWIIARSARSRPVVLGLSPRFTLASWMALGRRGLRSIPPSPSWTSYSATGVHTRIIRDAQRARQLAQRSGSLQPEPASGSAARPLLTGESAIARGSAWMQSQNLIPPLGD